MRFRAAAVWIAAFVLSGVASAQPAVGVRTYEKQVAPGVVLLERVEPSTPLAFTALKVDPRKEGVRVGAFVGNNFINTKERETVGSAVARTRALAGANGDFFPWTCDPLGLTVVDGRLVSEPWVDRPAVGVFSDGRTMLGTVRMALTFEFPNGRLLKANGVDRPLGAGELIAYDRTWSPSTGAGADAAELVLDCKWSDLTARGEITATAGRLVSPAQSTTIGLDGIVLVAQGPRVRELTDAAADAEGKSVKIKLLLQDDDGRSWVGVRDACGGGNWLLKDGKVLEKSQGDGFSDGFRRTRHPRTSVGVTRNGYILIAVVDGRQTTSRGASLPELAAVMQNQGCTDAINLDGGGSSTLVVGDVVINSPSDGQQRAVASGLLVFAPESSPASIPAYAISPTDSVVRAGSQQQYSTTPASEGLIWGTKNGGGFVEQNGLFTALRKGSRMVAARSQGVTFFTGVTVVEGKIGGVTGAWDPSTPATAPARRLNISVTDASGSPSPSAEVTLTVTGGTANPPEVHCDSAGSGSAIITWDASSAPESRTVEMNAYGVTAKVTNTQ